MYLREKWNNNGVQQLTVEKALDLFTKCYQDGVDTYLQVVTSQTNALQNERNDIDLRQREMDASVLLIKASCDASSLPKLAKHFFNKAMKKHSTPRAITLDAYAASH